MTMKALPRGWKIVKLEEIASPIIEKAGKQKLETLSISAGVGFVNQAIKFGKELSGKQYVNYSVIRRGDFSFNKGNSRKYPHGCIYKLHDRDIAAVPNAFYSFKINGQYNDYYEQLFISGYLNRQLKKLINTGVRDDGLFNLYEDDFYNCFIPLPPISEQRAIAEILTIADKLIAIKERLIDAKQKQKQWLMRNLLTGKIRLLGFTDNWERMNLSDTKYFNVNPESNKLPNEFYYIDLESIESGKLMFKNKVKKIGAPFRAQRVLSQNDIIFQLVRPYLQNNFILNCEFDLPVVASTGYAQIRTNQNPIFIFYLIHCDIFLKNSITKSSGSNYPAINVTELVKINFFLPPLPEQQAIAEILTTADREIELLKKELEQQKLIKKYLTQQLLTGKIRVNGA